MADRDFELPFEDVRRLLIELAGERELAPLLRRVVEQLARHADVALARIWLTVPGDEVDLLELVASAGRSQADPDADWSRLDGDFSRFEVGQLKIGSVAARAEPLSVFDARQDASWIARPDWASSESVIGFGGQPLLFHGDVLGVLGVFTRSRFGAEALDSLRTLADHAAAAIANARAFEENTRLRAQLELENAYLRDEIREAQAFGDIIGESEAIRSIGEQIAQVAPTDATVLILGESGTGKELVAREIHARSERANQPLIRVNCASVPKDLYESEFFGHVKGAFTGAVKDRQGRFAAADGGTLFLDEVGEIPIELQSKLLRVLQEGQYERVGDDRTRDADVRIIAATNQDLAEAVQSGAFREDLYYRLNVFPLEVPPLRERRDDVALLAEAFLEAANKKLKRAARLSPENRETLRRYDWPGNIRELQNAIERAVITSKAGRLEFPLAVSGDAAAPSSRGSEEILTDAQIRELERENLVAALDRAGGRIYGEGGAAELLGMKPTTVASRVARLGLGSKD